MHTMIDNMAASVDVGSDAGGRKEKSYDAPKLSALGLDDDAKALKMEGRKDLIKPEKLHALAQALAVKTVRQMVISQIPLGQQGVDAMQGVFKAVSRLEHLVAEGNDLHAFGATSLGHSLGSMRGLRVLEIADNEMGPKGFKAMLHGIRNLSGLEVIGVAGNKIANEGLDYLAASLRATQGSDSAHAHDDHNDKRPFGVNLTSLNLGNNGIGPEGCVALFGSLVGLDLCTQIRRLDISDNPITYSGSNFSGVAALRESLREMTSISSLNLANTKLNTEGGMMVVEGLVHKEKTMQAQVRVFWRKIGVDPNLLLHERRALEEQAQSLEQAFRRYNLERPLKELNLGFNALGMEGMRAIGDAKGIFACLTTLDIGSNEMTGNTYNPTFDGTVKLTDALKTAKNLTYLNISDNRISTESGEQTCLPTLCESLYLLQRLTYLDISSNNMGPMGSKVFAGSLASLRVLRYLDVSNNRLESQGMKDLAPALRGTLTDVNLSSNDIGPDGVTALTNQLPSLTSLTKLDLSLNRLSHAFSLVERGGSPDVDQPGAPLKSPVGAAARPRKIGFKDVAAKMSISHGEVRKLALMAQDTEGGFKRGFTAFAQACGVHLINISSIVIGVTIAAGEIRNKGPALNLSSRNYGQEDVIIIGELLKQNSTLTAVDLSQNDLTLRGRDLRGMEVLSEWLLQANGIKQLDLSHVFLTDGGAIRVGKGLFELQQLETLKLKGNHLSSNGVMALSAGVSSLSALTHLDISQNPLGALENKADREAQWEVREGLKTFSLALQNCVKLKMLDIRDCELRDEGGRAIALALSTLSELEHLYISGNQILEQGQEDIGSAIRKCTQVEVTDDIQMPQPDAAGRMVWALSEQVKAVYQASLISNCIRRAQFVSLDLSGNQIGKNNGRMQDLAEAFGCLSGLEDLNLSDNGPFSVEVCRELSKSLQYMTTLRTLRLADNSISDSGADALMCTIVGLPKLKELDIRNNRFKFFPVALPNSCPELLRLEVSGNPWLCPSQTVMSRNAFQIREHLSNLFQEGTIDRDVVLALVGCQLVGKTSLLRALMSSSGKARHIAVDERTKGLAFRYWQPAGAAGPNFTAFDFAGMNMYRDIQANLFLPRRALYCLVWRPFAPHAGLASSAHYRVRSRGSLSRTELRSLLAEQVVGWLATLYQRVPGCSVMLVGTHADDMMPEEELGWQSTQVENAARAKLNSLKHEFPDLQPVKLLLGPSGSIPMVSCRSGHGVATLRSHIVASASALPFFGEFLPRPWLLVRQRFLPQERKEEHEAASMRGDGVPHAAAADQRKRHGSLLSESEVSMFQGRKRLGSTISDTDMANVRGRTRHGSVVLEADTPITPGHVRRRHMSMQSESEALIGEHDPSAVISPTGSAPDALTEFGLSAETGHLSAHESSFHSQDGESASLNSVVGGAADKAARVTKVHRPGTMGGYLWIGHFKRLVKGCGLDDCQVMELLRYLHDSGLVRFFAFDEGPGTWKRENQNFEGFEKLDPYRSTGCKIATNSSQSMLDKHPPYGTREQAWANVLDTVMVDVPWLTDVITQIVDCSALEALRLVREKQGGLEIEGQELEEAAWALHKESWLRWSKAGGYSILRELWIGCMPEHDMRRIRNVLEGQNVLRFAGGRMTVPALKKREGTPTTAGQTSIFVSSDRNPSVVNNKEQNMARPWSRLLTNMIKDITGLQVRSTNRLETEDVARETVASCGVFVMVVTDSYFRSRICTTELALALELAMPIIPIILPQYSHWPPAVKDGCWWEDHGIANINNLFLSDPVDLSLEQFKDLLDTLLETAQMAESRTASVAGSVESDDAQERWSMLEDSGTARWGMMEATGMGLDGPTPPSTATSAAGPPVDPVPNVREVLVGMQQRMAAKVEEQASQGVDESDIAARQAELAEGYEGLCAAVEGALNAINARAQQNTWFPITDDPDEVALHYKQAVVVLKTFDSAQYRAKERAKDMKDDRERRARDRLANEEEAKRNAIEELEANRINAELWQRDPLHAKIAILHNVANISRGLGVEPKWNDKEQIVARAQQMAKHPSMLELIDGKPLGETGDKTLGHQLGADGMPAAEAPLAGDGEDSEGGAEVQAAGGSLEDGGGEVALAVEEEDLRAVREPLFDMMFSTKFAVRRDEEGGDESEEEEMDLTLTLGLEQQSGKVMAPPLESLSVEDSVPSSRQGTADSRAKAGPKAEETAAEEPVKAE